LLTVRNPLLGWSFWPLLRLRLNEIDEEDELITLSLRESSDD